MNGVASDPLKKPTGDNNETSLPRKHGPLFRSGFNWLIPGTGPIKHTHFPHVLNAARDVSRGTAIECGFDRR